MIHTFRNGKWYDKATGEEVIKESRAHTWRAGSSFQIAVDYRGYDCPVTGRWIDGKAAHRENLKRTGCRVQEPGEKEHYIKNRERELDRSAERIATQMVNSIAHTFE